MRDERGSITPLVVGFAAIVLLLVAVVVDTSAAYLRRQGLDALSDAAALAATEGMEGEAVYSGGLGEQAGIDRVAAREYVAEHLRVSGGYLRYPGLRFRVSTRDRTVVVHLEAPLQLPLRVPGVLGETTVTADAASQVLVSQ